MREISIIYLNNFSYKLVLSNLYAILTRERVRSQDNWKIFNSFLMCHILRFIVKARANSKDTG